MKRHIFVLVLVIAVMPAAPELIEFAVHAASHGDLAHEAGGEHANAGDSSDEHGCSSLFHLCACHAPTLSTPAAGVRVLFAPGGGQDSPALSPRVSIDLLPEPPPIRPPIA